MHAAEPATTAIVLLVVGALTLTASALSGIGGKLGVPVVVLFLLLGVLAGSNVSGLALANDALAFRIGTAALVFILFDGGLGTRRSTVRRFWGPASLLATLGVVLTAVIVGAAARAVGFAWSHALLLGAIVSSTDAAAIFSVLRSARVFPCERVAATLELESGLNDPVAVILTMTMTERLVYGGELGVGTLGAIALEIGLGAIVGAAVGAVARAFVTRVDLPAAGMYPLVTSAFALIAYGAASLTHGSGFLAVYVVGVVLGNTALPYRGLLVRVHDFIAWAGQLAMFLVLGLTVPAGRVVSALPVGLALGLVACFVARPLAVAACLAPWRYGAREIVGVSWGGLKGAVPIVLALVPAMAGVAGASRIFDVVFFVVLLSAALQGGTLRAVVRRLHLARASAPPPAVLEITSRRPLRGDVLAFDVTSPSAACGGRIAEVPLPEDSGIMLVVRAGELLPARSETILAEGDQVYVFCRPEDRPLFLLIFGAPKE